MQDGISKSPDATHVGRNCAETQFMNTEKAELAHWLADTSSVCEHEDRMQAIALHA